MTDVELEARYHDYLNGGPSDIAWDEARRARAREKVLEEALQLALDSAEGWIESELHGTSRFKREWDELEPARAALASRPQEEKP